MIEGFRKLLTTFNQLNTIVKSTGTRQVTRKEIIDTSRSIVDEYFRRVRPGLVNAQNITNQLSVFDTLLHGLLELTQKTSAKSKYLELIKRLKNQAVEIEKLLLVDVSNHSNTRIDPIDKQILDTLQQIIPSSAQSYAQALKDLDSEGRLSWRGPATDLREALRECLDHLAPDAEVTGQKNFKYEPNLKQPTMKQKVKYILSKRQSPSSVLDTTEKSVTLIDEIMGGFVRSIYTRTNVSTHTQTGKKEVLKLKNLVNVAFVEILSL